MPRLTEQDILAFELTGAAAPAVADASVAAVETPAAVETSATEDTGEQAQAAVETPAAVVETKSPSADLVSFLQAQVKERDQQVLDLTLSNRDLKAKVDTMQVTHAPMVKIVQDSISKMKVALGGSAVDLSGLAAEAVLEEHARASADFQKVFKVGGVAITAPVNKQVDEAAAAASSLESAKLAAVRFGKK